MAIYLDNAATSHPKPEAVYRAADKALRELGASPGRGSYRSAIEASRLLFETRLAAAKLFGISDAARIVFTASATEALNLALFGLLNPGDRVVTTSMEHNAVLRPLELLRRKDVEVVKVSANRDGFVEPIQLKNACTQKTRLLALSHCSPSGYRMPTKTQWEGVNENNTQYTVGTWSSDENNATNYSSGRFFGDDLMLPATGKRHYGQGLLSYRGKYGHYWSSTGRLSYSYTAWYLNFTSSGANMSYNDRKLGFSVRCVMDN